MKNKYVDIRNTVFFPAVILLVVFMTITLIVGDPMLVLFDSFKDFVTEKTGWLFILVVNVFIVFCLYLGFSKYGSVRLGGKDATPDFSTSAWFAMLFSAGMGIGLLFYGVAEPVSHYAKPPVAEPFTVESAQDAMNFTFLHWGIHAWAIYAVVALSLAFFAFNRNMPLTIRSVFYPLLGDRIHGWMGDVIDVFSVLATIFGLATSLGVGVRQVSGGLSHVFDTPNDVLFQVILIAVITGIATISVVSGVDKGVRVLSEWNVRIAGLLLVFVLIFGPTLFVFKSFIQNMGTYVNELIEVSTWTEAFVNKGWQGDWTVFYWAWWVSWSPFVGMFIARISKGRTIREFVFGVLLAPSILTFFWMTTLGGSAIFIDMQEALIGSNHEFAKAIVADETTALFVFLEKFPLKMIGSVLGILLVASFFVTSADSGSLVIDSITSGGKLNTPTLQRVFWASTEGAVAAVLLIGGGLTALQTATISTGLPFLIILTIMCYSLLKGVKKEYARDKQLTDEVDQKSYANRLTKVIMKQIDKSKKS